MIYENTEIYTIKKGCPWYEMQQFFGPPNVNWCEPTYCQLVNEPSTAWSNFGMIIPGLIIHLMSKSYKNPIIRNFGLCLAIMGLFSFFYHATNNYGTQFLDFIGMYVYTGAMITINIFRFKPQTLNKPWKIYYLILALNTLIFGVFHFLELSIQFTIIMNIVVILCFEFLNAKRSPAKHKHLYLKLFFISLAQMFSLLDHTRIWCNPLNKILHGHAIWHVLAGISGIFAYLYYRQFDEWFSIQKTSK